jgi:Bacterial regulatory protein, Fis family
MSADMQQEPEQLLREAGSHRSLSIAAQWLVGYKIVEVERELILTSLSRYHGNRTLTAAVLGISIRTLRNKINEYSARGTTVTRPFSKLPYARRSELRALSPSQHARHIHHMRANACSDPSS